MTQSAGGSVPVRDWKGTDRYEVLGRLGEGGMGVVYKAFDREREQHVALKTLHRMDPAGLYLFKQEFRALAGVQHHNLVRLHELVVTEAGVVFFAMELVRGVDFLRYVRGLDPDMPLPGVPSAIISAPTRVIDRRKARPPSGAPDRPSPPPVRLPTLADMDRLRDGLAQLVQGIQALHVAGKLHRDVKPANVVVTPEGRVVLLDFGVVAELYAIVERLADRSKDSEGIQVFYQAKSGIRHFLHGRWKQAREVLDATYDRYPNNRGSANSNFYLFSLYSLWMLGDLVELAKRRAHMSADAEQRGDLYTSVNVRTAFPALTFVAADDLEAARRSVKGGMASWSHSGYSVQHWQALMTWTFIDLYAGDGAGAYARLASEASAVKRSFLLVGSQFMRGYYCYARGVVAVASIDGAPASRERRLAEARRMARALEKEGMAWTKPLAAIVSAVASNASGDRRAAAEALQRAVDLAMAADMTLYAAAARHRLGVLQGDGGQALVVEAERAMEAQDVRSPGRLAAMLVPGHWLIA